MRLNVVMVRERDISFSPCCALDGAEIHPVKQHHGSLYADGDVMMRLKLELTRGLVRR